MEDNERDRDRGTYSPPTEDHLSYETRRQASRDQTPITLIASGIVLVVLLLAVVLFYNSGLNSRKVAEVGTPVGDYKDAGVEDAKPLSDEDLLDPALGTENPTFAEGAEQPKPREVINEAPAPVAPIKGPLTSESSATATPPAQTTTPSAAAPAAKPGTPPVVNASAATPKPAASGSAAVQIGAFGSREIADREYNAIASNYGLFLNGTAKSVERIERDGTVLYRTSFAGFASKEKASEFCNVLKSAGKSCFVR